MRRSLWIILLVLVLGGFAGFQQFKSWSLNKPQAKSEGGPEERSADRAQQGRSAGGRSPKALPVPVATRKQKPCRLRIGGVVNASPNPPAQSRVRSQGYWIRPTSRKGKTLRKGSCSLPSAPVPLKQ